LSVKVVKDNKLKIKVIVLAGVLVFIFVGFDKVCEFFAEVKG
jgi:uncharacterized membrane protein YkgB